jgi:glycosyltransferase involved in cell wall biosynthesis
MAARAHSGSFVTGAGGLDGAVLPELSLVIPTYNGRRVLPAVLRGLEAQRGAPKFEVVIVDDGSDDGTPEWLTGFESGLDLRLLSQEHKGPAAARNAGVGSARGELVVFLGDDTVPTTDWLAAHYEARRSRRQLEDLTVVGFTSLHPRIRRTPFLRWLYSEGEQFAYDRIEDAEDVSFEFFYSSNLSLPRRWLLDEPFDTSFPYAAWEDIELGYRLQKRGMRIVFERRAHLLHDHATSLPRFCRRQERAGYCAVVFYRRHPELGGLLGLGPGGPPARPRLAGHLLRAPCARLLERLPVEPPPRLWREVLRYHYVRGLERGWAASPSAALR